MVELVSNGTFSPELTVKRTDGSMSFNFPTAVTRPFFAKMTDLENRVKHMDEIPIDIEVISTWVDVFGYDLSAKVIGKYSKALNESLSAAARSNPQRLRFVATVPLPFGELAAETLKDAVDRLGAIGSMIGTNIAGANLDDPRLEPFWDASEKLSAPVILHPLKVAGANRLSSHYLHNLVGNPFDTTIAASSLIFGGVMDRHPDLRIVLVHGGGYFPSGIGRLDHGFNVRPETKGAKNAPSSYLRRFYYDTVVYDARVLKSLVDMVGRDRIVIGSDYPFDMEPKNYMEYTKSVFGESMSTMLQENTKRVFPLL